MKEEGVEDPVRWTLEQLKTRFPAMIKQAGYEKIAETIDQQAIADQLTRLETEIIAKYQSALDCSRESAHKCLSPEHQWIEASGQGTIYSYVIAHEALRGWTGEVPYVVAIIELAEGPYMISNVGTPFDQIKIGMP